MGVFLAQRFADWENALFLHYFSKHRLNMLRLSGQSRRKNQRAAVERVKFRLHGVAVGYTVQNSHNQDTSQWSVAAVSLL